MKKTLNIITALSVLLLTGCTNSQPAAISNVENDAINVTGGFSYYLQSDNSFAPYKKSALNRICFEPAQLETINDGAIFCFTNTQEALNLFGFKAIDNDCKYYGGTAAIKIKNLTDKNLSNAKSDPCVESGTCQFNEAELIEVSEMNKLTPKCAK